MKKVGIWAVCLMVCLAIVGFGIEPALAEHGWTEDPPQKGKPEDPPNPTVAPTYYGQPMALDDSPWVDPPRRRNKPDPDIPTMGSLAWWMQMALDENPWGEKPPKPGKPEPE